MNDNSTKTTLQRKVFGYVTGFVLSVALTLAAYITAVDQTVSGNKWSEGAIVGVILGLAAVQLVVQFVFFFHIGRDPAQRLHVLALGFMILIVGIIVGGSLWIMKNLDYHMMPSKQLDKSIIEDEGIKPERTRTHDYTH